jgi:hypothetical protein
MMFEWQLPTAEIFFDQRTPEVVLVELDGPQLITATDSLGRRYLGLFADRPDEQRELWLFALITNLELEALFAGAVSMRNAISKPQLDLVEYSDDRQVALWKLTPEQVPASIFPVADANLPVEEGSALLAKLLGKTPPKGTEPIFRCGGRPVRGSEMAFGALSGISGGIQSLWTVIANDVLPEPRTAEELGARADAQTLRMLSSMAASFGMVVTTDNAEAFRKIAETYRALARLTPDTLKTSGMSPALLAAYGEYLKMLSDLDAEVFAQLGDSQAYIGAAYAARVCSAMRVLQAGPKPEPAPPTAFTGHGFFHAVDIDKRTFVFFDAITNQEIRGKIAKDIAERLEKPGREIGVGNQTLYDVQIELVGTDRKATLEKLYEARPRTGPA